MKILSPWMYVVAVVVALPKLISPPSWPKHLRRFGWRFMMTMGPSARVCRGSAKTLWLRWGLPGVTVFFKAADVAIGVLEKNRTDVVIFTGGQRQQARQRRRLTPIAKR